MMGLTQNFVVPFALALKATVNQVALLTGVPGLLAALLQLETPELVYKLGSQKRLILRVVFVQAVMWVPILAIPYIIASHQVWWLIGLFTLSTICGSLCNPAWGSLMSELVPAGMRGRYFGFRSQILGLTTLLFTIMAAAILSLFSQKAFLGFSSLFGGAMVARFISWHFLKKMYEPPLTAKRESFTLTAFLTGTKSQNLRRYVFFVAAMNFAVNLAAPFFAVYMLRDLGFSYITYVLVITSSALVNSLSLTFWGRRSDRLGNRRVLLLTSCLIPLIPLLWVADQHLYWLIPVELLSGFAWAGFTLCSVNFVYDASPSSQRTGCLACFNALNGIALCLGAFLGGYLITYLPSFRGSAILSVFIVSGLVRAIVAATMLPRFKDVRQVRETRLTKSSQENLAILSGALIKERQPGLSLSLFPITTRYYGNLGSCPRRRMALAENVLSLERSPPNSVSPAGSPQFDVF
jgi:MFS family permease